MVLTAMYEKTDYQLIEENGENWRPFWWYNGTVGGWPSDENDTLGGNVLASPCLAIKLLG